MIAEPLLLVHVTPASYRTLPHRLQADDLAVMSIMTTLTVDLVKESLTRLVEEAAMRCPHLDGRGLITTLDAMLSDLSGDVGGAFSKAAETERDELYDGLPRGPMYRRRTA